MKKEEDFREKIAKAINAGHVSISQDPDGILRYTLTKSGLEQWQKESPNGSWRKSMSFAQHFSI